MTAFRQRICRLASPVVGSLIFFLLTPLVALAAEQAAHSFETEFGTSPFIVASITVQFLWVVGYCASSLAKWAVWKDGTRQERLEIVSTVFAAACAGNLVYYATLYAADLKQVYGFIGAMIGGFGGEKIISSFVTRYTGMIEKQP